VSLKHIEVAANISKIPKPFRQRIQKSPSRLYDNEPLEVGKFALQQGFVVCNFENHEKRAPPECRTLR
jgi:hypothetical protein